MLYIIMQVERGGLTVPAPFLYGNNDTRNIVSCSYRWLDTGLCVNSVTS